MFILNSKVLEEKENFRRKKHKFCSIDLKGSSVESIKIYDSRR